MKRRRFSEAQGTLAQGPRARRAVRPRSVRQGGTGQAGFSLVELLVAVVIGMGLVMAITSILIRYEGGRRSLTASNDSSQNGAYVAYTLDRMLRSAGSGYAQSWRAAFGCRLLAARNGTQVLPRTSAFPAPFAGVPQNVRLAPLVVHAGIGTDGSDVLAIGTGSAGLGESPLRVLPGSLTGTLLRVPTTLGLRARDVVLVLQDTDNCMVQQVADGFLDVAGQQLNLGGTYASSTINSVNLSAMDGSTAALLAPLGNMVGNQPDLELVGVAANATLVSHDMLRLDGSDAVVPIADGVLDLRAVYGVDSNGDGQIDSWVKPTEPNYTAAALQDGSAAAQQRLNGILAVRVGLILRTAMAERETVAASQIVLFSDLGASLSHTRNFSSSERQQRYRAVEFTVPLRNVMLTPKT